MILFDERLSDAHVDMYGLAQKWRNPKIQYLMIITLPKKQFDPEIANL